AHVLQVPACDQAAVGCRVCGGEPGRHLAQLSALCGQVTCKPGTGLIQLADLSSLEFADVARVQEAYDRKSESGDGDSGDSYGGYHHRPGGLHWLYPRL